MKTDKEAGMGMFFTTVLAALAVALISNGVYTGVYPTDVMACGGLLGFALLFAVAGFHLYSITESFWRWMLKRLWAVLPTMLIAGVILLVLGKYSFAESGFFALCIYPTMYQFTTALLYLCIPFYFCMRIDCLRERLPRVMLGTAAVWLFVYILFYDKSVCHIDSAHQPMILFLYFECMLLGAWFKRRERRMHNKYRMSYFVFAIVAFGLYVASELLFDANASWAGLQLFKHVFLFVFVYFIFRIAFGLDGKMEMLPAWLKGILQFIAKRTLAIYAVGATVVSLLAGVTVFPLNWMLVTLMILIVAQLLYTVCDGIYALDELAASKLQNEDAEE